MSDVLRERLESIVGSGLAVSIRRKRDAALERGLEAKRVKVLQHKGDLLYADPQEDHASQLVAARMAFELDDAFPNRMSLEVDGQMRVTSDSELLAILASLGALPEMLPALPEGVSDAAGVPVLRTAVLEQPGSGGARDPVRAGRGPRVGHGRRAAGRARGADAPGQ